MIGHDLEQLDFSANNIGIKTLSNHPGHKYIFKKSYEQMEI